MTGDKYVLIYLNLDIQCCGPISHWLVVESIICQMKDGHNLDFKYTFPHWYGFLGTCTIDVEFVRFPSK
jgi:hypothetical protein